MGVIAIVAWGMLVLNGSKITASTISVLERLIFVYGHLGEIQMLLREAQPRTITRQKPRLSASLDITRRSGVEK